MDRCPIIILERTHFIAFEYIVFKEITMGKVILELLCCAVDLDFLLAMLLTHMVVVLFFKQEHSSWKDANPFIGSNSGLIYHTRASFYLYEDQRLELYIGCRV